jgi:hypothetical protein
VPEPLTMDEISVIHDALGGYQFKSIVAEAPNVDGNRFIMECP